VLSRSRKEDFARTHHAILYNIFARVCLHTHIYLSYDVC